MTENQEVGGWKCPCCNVLYTNGKRECSDLHCPGYKPHRVQRKRTKGWKMPPNTVYVGRPSQWGNPFLLAKNPIAPQIAVDRFKLHLDGYFSATGLAHFEEWIKPLRGKNLACFCSLDQPCHADILLQLANQP